MNPAEMGMAVRDKASELGFDLVGFGSAGPFEEDRDLFLEHLQAGYYGQMGWITPERVQLSCDPEALLPGAKSFVGLGISYAQEAGGGVGADGAPPSLSGRVARYAWGRDYHDVI